MTHIFSGKWITNSEFANLKPRNVFHKQLEQIDLPCNEHRNRHILFRKSFICDAICENSYIYISADDYYKLYINGVLVTQGPSPSYHFQYNYNVVNVAEYLREGENTIAIHTTYQGLINRVWQSGDHRHGLILDLVVANQTIISSDETFKTSNHTAYLEEGVCGYDTQFLESYNSNSPEVGFEHCDYDDSVWENAKISNFDDHTLVEQKSYMLVFEDIAPVRTTESMTSIVYDFGSTYVGYLCLSAYGHKGDIVKVRCAQELKEDGSLRYDMRANCKYEETWILSDGESKLDWFDYKSFRYAEICFPVGVSIHNTYLKARHYPFQLRAQINPILEKYQDIKQIWDLCIHTQKYGVQEVIQDCMEREKGFYLGDGCYTALTNLILTKDDSMVRKLIDDAFSTTFISDTLVTCMNCSFMQEIAEYPLILVFLLLWHYNYTGDKEYLKANYPKAVRLLEAYRRSYESDCLLRNLDKWCVVEWPKNFQHGYDVDVEEGKVCHQAHISINAYYIHAVRVVNRIADLLGLPEYRNVQPLWDMFIKTFYVKEKNLFRDGENTNHISLVGNSFAFGFDLCPNEETKNAIISFISEQGIHTVSFFCVFPILLGLTRCGRFDLIKEAIQNEGAWKRTLREGGTTTFEGWGKDTKWNTSLFHLTMSYISIFIADISIEDLLC